MSIELKVKAKSLAEEAKIIRNEEKKAKKAAVYRRKEYLETGTSLYMEFELQNMKPFRSLSQHRRWDVRNEARATHLARAFMKGMEYRKVEQKSDRNFVRYFIESRIVSMVSKYSNNVHNRDIKKEVREWLDASS